MAWNAKPSGGYARDSDQGGENILNVYTYCSNNGYTLQAVAGMLGNVQAESGLNPWRYEGDQYGTGRGYGLFQFTPARDYFNLGNTYGFFAPNKSTTSITSGASPDDGAEQIRVFDNDDLHKWGSGLWRPYWDTSTYADLYAQRKRILQEWGNGSQLTLSDFRRIRSVYDATFAFLAGYEGPAVPNMTARYNNARAIYVMLGGIDPGEDPDPPAPASNIPLWMLFKFNGR